MHRKAIAHLTAADPKLAKVIERVGECTLVAHQDGSHFDMVIRSIVYQQLSGKAAATIHGRVLALFGGRSPAPAELLEIDPVRLRGAGLSGQKTAYLKDLAARVASGELPIDVLHELPDEAVIEALVRVKGIGKWTAQMFLLFRLGRMDVLPDLDLGVRKGVQLAYRMRALPTPEQVLRIGRVWSPYSSIAAWYLWRSLDEPAAQAPAKKVTKMVAKKAAKKPVRAKRVKKRVKKKAKPIKRKT